MIRMLHIAKGIHRRILFVRLHSPRFEWLRNALGRTLLAFVPRLARPDDVYARSLLPEAEYRLYAGMDKRDRVHACAVAKRLLSLHPQASAELLRAALLHDVGKADLSYNPFARVLVALYTPSEIVSAPRLTGLRGAWQVKLHHDAYGEALIRGAGGSARVAEIVARHHRPGKDHEAATLKETDARF